MRSQMPDDALVTLLRKYYTAPQCLLSRSLPRRLHTPQPICPRLPRSSTATQRRKYQTHTGGSGGQVSRKVQSAAPSELGTPRNSRQKRIAVLGGGITGLSAAHYLTRELPTAKVTIYEASERLGGWLQSQRVDVGNGNVVFESGPRTLRPHGVAARVTIEMV